MSETTYDKVDSFHYRMNLLLDRLNTQLRFAMDRRGYPLFGEDLARIDRLATLAEKWRDRASNYLLSHLPE